jgi:hypothetical protein
LPLARCAGILPHTGGNGFRSALETPRAVTQASPEIMRRCGQKSVVFGWRLIFIGRGPNGT